MKGQVLGQGGVPRQGDNVALGSSVSGTTLKLRAPAGLYDGIDDNVTLTDADFIASNIRTAINLFGIVGTLVPGQRVAVGSLYAAPNQTYNISVGFPCEYIRAELNRSHNNTSIQGRSRYNNSMVAGQTNYGSAYTMPNVVYSYGSSSFQIQTDSNSGSDVIWIAIEKYL